MYKHMLVRCVSAVITAVVLLTSCASGGAGDTSAAGAGENTGTTAAADPDAKVLKIASTLAPDSSTIKLLEEMSAEITEKSGGSLDVKVFPASQLGGLRDFVEGISMGTIEMGMSPLNSLESFDSQFSIYGLPFLFRDDDHVYKFYDSEINQEILENFRVTQGIRALGVFNEGFRTVWTSGKPIESLEDFKGLKLRVPEIPVYVDMFTALGANATPMPASDVYTALQTGVIEGVELPISSIILNRFVEVLDYETVTNHCGNPMALLISDATYDTLTQEEVAILQEAVNKAAAQDRVNLAESTQEYLAEAAALGVQQITLSDQEMQKIQDAMIPVLEKYSEGVVSQEMMDQIRAIQ